MRTVRSIVCASTWRRGASTPRPRRRSRARASLPDAPPWVVDWLAAKVHLRLGRIEAAIASAEQLLVAPTGEARDRGFDFRIDERIWELLGQARIEAASVATDPERRRDELARAALAYERVLSPRSGERGRPLSARATPPRAR